MSYRHLFLKTLKRIGFPDADSLEDSDINRMFSEKELIPFLEVFCTLSENNVLTSDEIQEYAALTLDELAEIETLKKSKQLESNCNDYDKKKEADFLQEHLSYIEKHNKTLERQIELFKKHESELLEEKETRQNTLLAVKKKFQAYEMSLVPHAEEEFVSRCKSIFNFIEELESLMLCADGKESKIPSSSACKDSVKDYLENEDKILHSIRTFIYSTFQVEEKDHTLSFINSEVYRKEELMKEVSLLQKMLKQKMKDAVISDVEIKKMDNILKYYGVAESTSDLNCPPSQLRSKLNDALKRNENLKKKEEDLKKYVVDAISKYVDAQCTELGLCATREAIHNIHYASEKMTQHMNMLLQQRARLEVLLSFLYCHYAELQNLKIFIEKVFNQVKQEQLFLEERKIQVENKIAKCGSKKMERDPENSIFLYLYKILAPIDESGDEDLANISLQDILQKTNEFLETMEIFKKKYEEKVKTIEMIEEHATAVEALLNCSEKEYSNWQECEQTLNAELNSLDIQLTSLETSISECSRHHMEMQKLLESRANLRLARNMYVYALMNKDLFEKHIQDIKEAFENPTDDMP